MLILCLQKEDQKKATEMLGGKNNQRGTRRDRKQKRENREREEEME